MEWNGMDIHNIFFCPGSIKFKYNDGGDTLHLSPRVVSLTGRMPLPLHIDHGTTLKQKR
jgi:hypothetical protein